MHIDHEPGHTHDHPHTHEHTHEHTHDGHTHTHEHSHVHDHAHEHPHTHDHLHEDGHTHAHTHEHSHEHTHCNSDCGSCASKCSHTPMEELVALMKYMVGHNAAHANELAELAKQFSEAGNPTAYEQVMAAVSDFEKGNMRLSAILASLEVK